MTKPLKWQLSGVRATATDIDAQAVRDFVRRWNDARFNRYRQDLIDFFEYREQLIERIRRDAAGRTPET